MKGKTWLQLTITLTIAGGTATGLWAFVKAIDPGTIKVVLGFLLALATVLIVGLLFAGKDLAQAYIVRRQEREDALSDTRRLATWSRWANGPRSSGRNYPQLPGAAELPILGPSFTGSYRDTTLVDEKVEIE